MFANRKKGYEWLAEQVGLPKGGAHIGEFDEGQCAVAIKACQEKWRDVYANEVKK